MPHPKPSAFTRSVDVDAMVERVAPDVLALLADGVPRPKAAIVAAPAGRHDKRDVVGALTCLSVTGQVVEAGSKYTLGLAGATTSRPRPRERRGRGDAGLAHRP